MKSMRPLFGTLALLALTAAANADVWSFESEAKAYNPAQQLDSAAYNSLSEWQNHGMTGATEAASVGHPFEPPASGSWAKASLDQSEADNAVYRGLAISRVGYRVNESNEFSATSTTHLEYKIQVENQSNQALDIVFGNQMHGVMATVDNGTVYAYEDATIQGLGNYHNYFQAGPGGSEAGGLWTNSVSNSIYEDPFFGARSAYELNAYEFFGSMSFAAHSSQTVGVDLTFLLTSNFIGGGSGSGLAYLDFTNTGHVTVKAFDPNTGADRSDEINVTVVPEPMAIWGLALGLGGILLRCRRRPIRQMA